MRLNHDRQVSLTRRGIWRHLIERQFKLKLGLQHAELQKDRPVLATVILQQLKAVRVMVQSTKYILMSNID